MLRVYVYVPFRLENLVLKLFEKNVQLLILAKTIKK